MNYKLAKKLKKAGFLFKNDFEKDGYAICGQCGDGGPAEKDIPVTLSELIEACGDKFGILRKHIGGWDAESAIRNFQEVGTAKHTERGKTPEESVANLWLTIHNKQCL